MSSCLTAGDSSTNCGEKLKVLTDWRKSECGGETEAVSDHPSLHVSEAGGRTFPYRATDV